MVEEEILVEDLAFEGQVGQSCRAHHEGGAARAEHVLAAVVLPAVFFFAAPIPGAPVVGQRDSRAVEGDAVGAQEFARPERRRRVRDERIHQAFAKTGVEDHVGVQQQAETDFGLLLGGPRKDAIGRRRVAAIGRGLEGHARMRRLEGGEACRVAVGIDDPNRLGSNALGVNRVQAGLEVAVGLVVDDPYRVASGRRRTGGDLGSSHARAVFAHHHRRPHCSGEGVRSRTRHPAREPSAGRPRRGGGEPAFRSAACAAGGRAPRATTRGSGPGPR